MEWADNPILGGERKKKLEWANNPILGESTGYAGGSGREQYHDAGMDADISDMSKSDAYWFAGKLGLADTYRGVKQIVGYDEKAMAADESKLNMLMQHPEWGTGVKAAYFGGMIADPAGWLLPASKARTAYKMAKYGLGTGAVAGGLGYVDEEGGLSRGQQAALGAATGGVLAPVLGKTGQALAKKYQPIGDKTWQVLSKNPEVAGGGAGGILGYNVDQDAEPQDKLRNALIGATLGAGGRQMVRGAGKAFGKEDFDQDVGRYFIPEFGLSDKYLNLKGMSARERNQIKGQFNDLTRSIQEEPEEVRKALYMVLTDAEESGVALSSLTKQQRESYQAMNDLISKYGKELVDVGALDAGTFQKNLGKYLHRSYKNPGDEEKARAQVLSSITGEKIRVSGDELRLRGKVRRIGKEEWEVDGKRLLDEGWEELEHITSGQPSFVYDKGVKVTDPTGRPKTTFDEYRIIRRDYTPEERLEMGELTDVALAFDRTGTLLANDISAFKFYKAVADDFALKEIPGDPITRESLPRYISNLNKTRELEGLPPVKPSDYEFIPSSRIGSKGKERYGELAQKWVSKNIYNDIVTLDRFRKGDAWNKLQKLRNVNRWWKTTKTALNVPTHMNNIVSNMHMYDLHDGIATAFVKGWRDIRSNNKRFKEAKEFNVFSGGFVDEEIFMQNKAFYDAYGMDASVNTMDKLVEKVPDIAKKLAQKIGTGAKWGKKQTYERMLKLYQWEDYVFRMGLFNSRITQGIEADLAVRGLKVDSPTWKAEKAKLEANPPEDLMQGAAREAREGFVDYSKNSPFIYHMRETALPFISYSFGIIPQLAKASAQKPWKVAKWGAIYHTLNAIGEETSDTPTEAERSVQTDKDTLFGLPGMPRTTIKLPGPVSKAIYPEGDSGYLSMGRMYPGSGVHRGASETKAGAIPGLPEAFQPSGGAYGAVASGLLGVDPWQGRAMPDMSDRMKYIGRQFIPNAPFSGLPGIDTGLDPATFAGERMRRGLQEGGFQSDYADTQSKMSALLQSAGIAVKPIDASKEQDRQRFKMTPKIKDIERKIRKLDSDYETGKFRGRYEVYEKRMKKLEASLDAAKDKLDRLQQ